MLEYTTHSKQNVTGECILIIDDEKDLSLVIGKVLEDEGYRVLKAYSGQEGLDKTKDESPTVVLLDIRLPDVDGLELIKSIKEINGSVYIIMLTAYGSINSAVKAMKQGAYDYLTKPINNDELKLTIKRAIDTHKLSIEAMDMRKEIKERFSFNNIIGKSPQMQNVYNLIETVALQDVTVLIQGDSGTGKELVAKAIHYNSIRKDKPFQVVDCATLPETLVESELFGYEKGAFTGAVGRKIGRFERSEGGTLFLDEIGNLPPNIQMKLLRVIQERKIERLGGKGTIPIDTRIIAATNKNLGEEVKNGRFRDDLYYRISAFTIFLPPLREREGDMFLLAQHFLKFYSHKFKKEVIDFSSDVKAMLLSYSWPGNVREFENAIQQSILLTEGEKITSQYLPLSIRKYCEGLKLSDDEKTVEEKVSNYEKELIINALNKTQWSMTKAAKLLGTSFRSIRYKIKKYEIIKK